MEKLNKLISFFLTSSLYYFQNIFQRFRIFDFISIRICFIIADCIFFTFIIFFGLLGHWFFDILVAAVNISQEVAAVCDLIEVEAAGTGEGVGNLDRSVDSARGFNRSTRRKET